MVELFPHSSGSDSTVIFSQFFWGGDGLKPFSLRFEPFPSAVSCVWIGRKDPVVWKLVGLYKDFIFQNKVICHLTVCHVYALKRFTTFLEFNFVYCCFGGGGVEGEVMVRQKMKRCQILFPP